MPYTGDVDVSGILANLGDPTHNLVPARPETQSIDERDEIFRAAYGTIDMSTSMGLAVVPRVIWDVNGYYRSLGIEWPYKPTRRELRQAFTDSNGHSSERLTYYMKQLLNPQVREEYDRSPLGSTYRDKYIIEEEMRKLSEIASKVSEEEGKLVTVDDLVEEEKKYRESIPELPPAANNHIWNWGFYALKSRRYDTEALELWQYFLCQAFAQRQLNVVIAIGYIGNSKKEFDIKRHDERDVFFLNETTDPTPELAETAVSQYIAHRQKGPDVRHDRPASRRKSSSRTSSRS